MKNATHNNKPALAYISNNNYDIRHAFNVTGYWDCNKAPKEENSKGQCILIGSKHLRISNDTGGGAFVVIDRIEKGEFSHPGWLKAGDVFNCRVYFKKNMPRRRMEKSQTIMPVLLYLKNGSHP